MVRCVSTRHQWQCTRSNDQRTVNADTHKYSGVDDSFRPHEFLEAAPASCLNISIRMVATTSEIPLDTVTTTVELDREPDRTNFIHSIDIKHPTNHEVVLPEQLALCTVSGARMCVDEIISPTGRPLGSPFNRGIGPARDPRPGAHLNYS